MIWSIMPEDIIFAAEDKPEITVCRGNYLGRQLLLRPCGEGLGEITTLLSTDPADFLDSRFQIGRRIPLQ